MTTSFSWTTSFNASASEETTVNDEAGLAWRHAAINSSGAAVRSLLEKYELRPEQAAFVGGRRQRSAGL